MREKHRVTELTLETPGSLELTVKQAGRSTCDTMPSAGSTVCVKSYRKPITRHLRCMDSVIDGLWSDYRFMGAPRAASLGLCGVRFPYLIYKDLG